MRALLGELSYAEYWVWRYLVVLAREQGDSQVVIPKPGEDPVLDGGISRRYFREVLQELKAKRRLTQLVIPRSKSKRIEVFLPAWAVGEATLGSHSAAISKMEEPQRRNNEGLGSHSAAITTLGSHSAAIMRAVSWVYLNLGPSSAMQKEIISRYLSTSKAKDLNKVLKKKIKTLAGGEAEKLWAVLREMLVRGIGQEKLLQGKEMSKQAKSYAALRFLRHEMLREMEPQKQIKAIEDPGAWMATVAREADREWQSKSSPLF